jgi:hypothetical protein
MIEGFTRLIEGLGSLLMVDDRSRIRWLNDHDWQVFGVPRYPIPGGSWTWRCRKCFEMRRSLRSGGPSRRGCRVRDKS